MRQGSAPSLSSYTALLDARFERGPGVGGLLLKEKLGGKSLLSHSLDRFDEDERCAEVLVLATPAVHEWIAHDPLTFASGKLRLLAAGSSLPAALSESRETVLVYHAAERPHWQAGLLDNLLRVWQPGSAVLPAQTADAPVVRRGNAAGTSTAAATSAEDVFGSKPQAATPVHELGEMLDPVGLCLLETPQVYDRSALHKALTGSPESTQPLAAAHNAGMPLLLLPAHAHNFAVLDGDGLHLMRRLLGEAKKPSKDRYGGLGW